MLKHLYIKNFTLIDELDIEFHRGFSVVTGETGAGKSIIVGAIGLLMGNRADAKSIKQGRDKCVIEAHFDLSQYQMESFFEQNDIDYDITDCILRRELSVTGKSRGFINDTPVSLSLMRELGEQLIDVHSQHQNLLLNKEDFQLSVVDIIAADQKQLSDYRQSYSALQHAEQELRAMRESIERNKDNEEFLRFQYNELADANLVEGEQEEKEQQVETLSHAEEIKSALYDTDQRLQNDESGSLQSLKTATENLRGIEGVFPEVGELAERLNTTYIELKDIAEEVNSKLERIDFEPQLLDQLNSRLDKIYSLEQKYHVQTVEELIALRDNLKQQLDGITGGDEALEELTQKVSTLKAECEQKAKKLSQLRQQAARQVEKEMLTRLVPLGIPNVRFSVNITAQPLTADGMDKVSFLFSANKSTALEPISSVASGGEIARVMLSLKAMISTAVKLPTIIFDEIDTGVSGRVAEQMANIMRSMGDSNRQVISITHLPQIAAFGQFHYKVEKQETAESTISQMKLLDDEGRIREIAQMLSGSDITDAAISNAKELLKKK